MFRLALRTLRFRKGGFAASFIALFFGAVIVMACGGLMETGIRNAVPPQRLAAAPILVTGQQTFVERVRVDASLVGRIEAVPGVAKAVPDMTFELSPLRDNLPVAGGAVHGHAWASAELTPYALSSGTAPQGQGEVVLDTGVAAATGAKLGDSIPFVAGGKTEQFRLVGIASAATDNRSAFFADSDAGRLNGGADKVDAIGVLADPGVDVDALQRQVTSALPAGAVRALTGDDRGQAEFDSAQDGGDSIVTLAAVFGGLAIMVAMFVVAGTLGLSVQQRHREMALLRAIGTTPGQLRRMILGETAVVAVLATGLAYLPNRWVGRWLLEQLAASGVAPSAIAFRQGWIPIAAGAGISLLSAMVAAFVAGRGAAVTRPTEALMEASIQTRWFSWLRLTFALVCLGGGLALTLVTALVMTGTVAASTAGPTAMLWASGLALLSPGITKVILAVLRWPVRALTGLSGYLAVLNADARRVRVAGAITPVMLATGLATALIYLQTTTAGASGAPFGENLTFDAAVTSTSGGLPVAMVDTVRRQPGVAAASALVPSEVFFRSDEDSDDEATLLGITAEGAQQTLGVTVTAGSLADLRGNTAALSTDRREKVGDTVQLRLGDGTKVDAEVVASFEPTLGDAVVLMPADEIVGHTTAGSVPQILVKASGDAGALISTLQRLSDQEPSIRVGDRQSFLDSQGGGGGGGGEQTGAWVNYLLVGMILAYTVISLVNTLVIATGERRREFALQRLIGATHGQIIRMVGVEAVLISLGGIMLGAVVSASTLIPFAIAVYGSPWPSGPLWIYLAVVGGATALTLLSTLLSTGYVLRAQPVEAAAALD
jgi:putative ABC transport system permease protein